MTGALLSWARSRARPLILSGLVLVAYAGAITRAQSLPWLIAAMLLSTLIVGLSWPHWLVGRLWVTREGPDRAEEGETIAFRVVIRNTGLLPRFMVELVDHVPFAGCASGRPSDGPTLLGLVSYVPGRGTRQFAIPLLCEKRGRYRLGPVGLASSFPLGLAEARQRRNDGVQTLTIYPDVFPIVRLPLRGAPSQIHRGGHQLREGAGTAEFSSLREYRQGDNPRHIHWPTTARTNEMMVRQFEPLASACLGIALDLAADSNVGEGRHCTLEYSLRIAASVAQFACHNNIPTRVLGTGAGSIHIPAGSGAFQYQAILDQLAVVDADGTAPYAGVIEDIAAGAGVGETVVVFLAQAAAESAGVIRALALLRAKRAHIFAVVLERRSFGDEQGRSPPEPDQLFAGLQELDAYCVTVRRGDDLVQLFNP